METILLVDDREDHLAELERALRGLVPNAKLIKWCPLQGEKPLEVFEGFLEGNDVRLVVTDYDLTERGQLGLFGATVVDWCQLNTIPVGDFSRNNISSLATEPNLFELRVPVETPEIAARFIATVFEGFLEIYDAIGRDSNLMRQRSPASALAHLLGAQHLVSQFGQYGTRYGGAGAGLVDVFSETAPRDKEPSADRKRRVLTYIMGHLLVNAVMRFPGPLIDSSALTSYLAVRRDQYSSVEPLFQDALYQGPFSALGPFYWTDRVEETLLSVRNLLPTDGSYASPGAEHRALAELLLKRSLEQDSTCVRCNGSEGGFICPFTKVTVCQRPDCSVVSNIWIPPGARLCRFERDFYDEWAPILGM